MLSRGEGRVVVTDHTKFAKRGLIKVAGFAEIGDQEAQPEKPNRWPLEGLAVEVEITSFPAPGRPER